MIQNKLLAIKNSELTQRIADLEKQISVLVTENVSLQNRGISQTESNYRLQSNLGLVESVVTEKFSEILQEIAKVKDQEQIPQSKSLSAVLQALSACRPVTSTPQADREHREYELEWAGLPLLENDSMEASKERSVSVASLADLAMMEELEKSVSPELKEQNNVGKLLLPELSTKVSVLPDVLDSIEEEPSKKRPRKVKTEVKKEDKKKEPVRRKRRPLLNVTNRKRILRSKTPVQEEIENDIFEFVD